MRPNVASAAKHPRFNEKGFVLLAALLLLLLLAAVSAGILYTVNTETRLASLDLEGNAAYYAAEAGLEKMMVELGALYTSRAAPAGSDIQGLADSSHHPVFPGVTFPLYSIDVPSIGGMPVSQVRNVSSGPNAGLLALVVPMTLNVSARRAWGAEVRLTRNIEVALIPVFQFGVFFDRDLSYSAGADFDIGGRVHSNGNLFLASSSSTGLVLHAQVTAVSEVVRTELSNGLDTAGTGRSQPVYIPTAANGCDGSRPACRNLQLSEGSKVGGPSSANNPNWVNISASIYNGMIRNRKTGVKPMNLSFVAPGLRPIELVRRPPAGESPTSLMGNSRMYNIAQIRVLVSDRASDLPGGSGIRLANVAPYYDGATFGGANVAFAEGQTDPENGGTGQDFIRPPNPPGLDPLWPGACVSNSDTSRCWPLINGYLLVERRNSNGSYSDVTAEWLNLGIDRENTNAILKFQTYRDYNGDGVVETAVLNLPNSSPRKFYPLNLYDPREGEWRDVPFSADATDTTCASGGIINVAELDVGNLRRWLTGAIGSTGTQTESASQNGYILYFSDRRGQRDVSGNATGSYRYEDVIDPSQPNGAGGWEPLNPITPNGALDPAEDVNENGVLDTDGAVNIGDAFGVANGNPSCRVSCRVPSNLNAGDDFARKNRVSGARHALKLVDGSLGNLPTKPDGSGGFTVASENPVYVQGNYNADSAGFGTGNAAAAIIADSVTLLSNNWNDLNSFKSPTRVSQGRRDATTTWYRMGIIAGKAISFARPAWPGAAQDFGTDGGLHNFLRLIENWSGQTIYFMGSLVSLYFSEYANGTFKCCSTVYRAPGRAFSFDTNFLDLSRLPPGTPYFRNVVDLGAQQVSTPY